MHKLKRIEHHVNGPSGHKNEIAWDRAKAFGDARNLVRLRAYGVGMRRMLAKARGSHVT